MSTSSPRLGGLDGLRAASVAGVIVYHLYSLHSADFAHTTGVARITAAVALRGAFGVTVFFALSGFLITWLLLKEEKRDTRIDMWAFYVRRGLRILPPAFAYLAVLGFLSLVGVLALPGGWHDLVHAAGFIRNYYPQPPEATAHYWSLAVEEQFYLIWPLLVVFAPRAWRVPFVVLLLIGLPLWKAHLYTPTTLTSAAGNVTVWRFEMVCDALLMGCLLALLRARRAATWHKGRWALAWAALGLVFVGICLSPAGQQAFGQRWAWAQSAGPLGVILLINFVLDADGSWIRRILDFAPLAFVGRLSYSLYLWQQLFCFARPVTWWVGKFPQNVILSFLCALSSYALVELPSLRVRDWWMRRHLLAPPVPRPLAPKPVPPSAPNE